MRFIPYLLLCFCVACADPKVEAKPIKKNEAYYVTKLAKELGGKTEVRVESGRVDILTDSHAIEVEWASKWKNSIGQALWYSLQTGKKPMIILLEKKETDYKYFIMLNSALEHGGLKMKTEYRKTL